MGNLSTKQKLSAKPTTGSAAHATPLKRNSKQKRESSAIHLQTAKDKRSKNKGLSLKRLSLAPATVTRVSSKSQAKRGSITIGRKVATLTEKSTTNTSTTVEIQDYDHIGHDVALHILHSTPSQVRRHLEKLGAADGLGSDNGSDTESDFETDDEEDKSVPL